MTGRLGAAALGLCLLALPARAAVVQVESTERQPRPGLEATPEHWARLAQACRADLADYQARSTMAALERLFPCLAHPDAKLRALVLDKIVNRQIWEAPEFKREAYPRLREAAAAGSRDPDMDVKKFAFDMTMWLDNWARDIDPDVVAARARQEAERQARARREEGKSRLDLVWIGFLLVLCAVMWIPGLLLKLKGPRSRR